jgi:hypothetical protein
MRVLIIAVAATIATGAAAHWKPEYAQMYTPQELDWFKRQKVPGGSAKGTSCCSVADGTFALEDIRDGHYWTKFHYTTSTGEEGEGTEQHETDWVQVPDEVVIDGPNLNRAPAVWYYFENGKPKIRCYSPGAKM